MLFIKGSTIIRELIFLFFASIFIYLGISTILPTPEIVGGFGKSLGYFNLKYFGYLAFAYPFLFLIPIYSVYKNPKLDRKRAEIITASFLIFFCLILAQSASLSGQMGGFLGSLVVGEISLVVGKFGVWIFVTICLMLSLTLLFEISTENLVEKIFHLRTNIFTPNIFDIFKSKNTYIKAVNSGGGSGNNGSTSEGGNSGMDKNSIDSVDKNRNSEKKGKINLINSKSLPKNASETEISEGQEQEQQEEQKGKSGEVGVNTALRHNGVEIVSELEENKKLLEEIEKGGGDKPKNFKLPSVEFLAKPPKKSKDINEGEIDKKIAELLDKLRNFNIKGDVIRTYTGPVVTTFEFKPAIDVKVSKVVNLQDDLAMALKASTIRIQAPIPGKDVIGIEIPNKNIETIYMRDILESDIFKQASSPLTIALGKDIVGNPFVTDLKRLPHLLIAGTTGSGKSVGINAMILSLLYRNSPENLRLIMIDPKMLEFSIYNDIPHLLTPVITQPKQAINALANTVIEMERRYKIMSKSKTKNIENYNEKAKIEGLEELPYIVVIIDELADLMMTSGKEVEVYIARLAQMARASGIHLVVATQRPSVDVVTGLIKANLPSRVSFKVGQKIDSKVILDSMGAESLLGRGDMLFTPPGSPGLVRLHAPFTSEGEIEQVVEHLKSQQECRYDESFLRDSSGKGDEKSGESGGDIGELDELYDEAKNIVLEERKTSISYIQRRLGVGYNRAANIVEQLQTMGVLSAADKTGKREILI